MLVLLVGLLCAAVTSPAEPAPLTAITDR
jgi:hypothetical protein